MRCWVAGHAPKGMREGLRVSGLEWSRGAVAVCTRGESGAVTEALTEI